MEKAKKMLVYLIIVLMGFYLLPLIIKDTGTGMLVLLVFIPLICFGCSVAYGVKNSFNPFYALTVAVLFVPSIFIFYNSSAWVYTVGYAIIALAGNAIGTIFHRRTN